MGLITTEDINNNYYERSCTEMKIKPIQYLCCKCKNIMLPCVDEYKRTKKAIIQCTKCGNKDYGLKESTRKKKL
jgi:hypothetical protein